MTTITLEKVFISSGIINLRTDMKILGINETTHDASISLIEDGEILFAGHAERFSKQKNDWFNNDSIIDYALQFGKPDRVAYYENRWLKKLRISTRGGFGGGKPYYLDRKDLRWIPRESFSHHYSHAAAGYYTSNFQNAVIVVLDAIGEYNTSTVWVGNGSNIRQVYKQNYPLSFGLFYSAFTQLVGLKPNEEEYIFMGMAAYGDWTKYYIKVKEYFPNIHEQKYAFHNGILDWGIEISQQDKFDIAAAVQRVYEDRLVNFMAMAQKLTGEKNLVFMGGCALNCSANTMLWRMFDNVWIMPNPGDAGSSLGAAAAAYGNHINWQTPYLGYDLGGEYPVTEIITELIRNKVAAVATGKAEYGPRALGNRSILADPRDPNIKDKVNLIKKRELFRPFAPVVMEEHASKWFDMKFTSPYMQYAVKCLQPEKIPSVVHKDGTSRVQTVNEKQHPGLYAVLSNWYTLTGVPVLLNTSLNIKGQPLLNDETDIVNWENTYNTRIVR
jgi:carbamoyltransferase